MCSLLLKYIVENESNTATLRRTEVSPASTVEVEALAGEYFMFSQNEHNSEKKC